MRGAERAGIPLKLRQGAQLIALVLVLAACAGQDVTRSDAGTAATAPPKVSARATSVAYEDVAFVQMMLAHDRQTVRLCELLQAKSAVDPSVRDLSERIRVSRASEIEQLISWLSEWGLDESPLEHEHAGRGHGLLLPGQMLRFERAAGPAAQAAFVQVMITRDQGARQLATSVVSTGLDPSVRRLATSTIATGDAETAELRTMRDRR